jgi:site-specific DNA-methyltransferase (adenine-specific)
MNKFYFRDNLEILREMPDERVHLICTDPPFNSGRDYNTFLGDSLAQKKAFTNT